MDGTEREGGASRSAAGEGGRVIAGYDDLMRIGSGGSSTVYRANDVRHQRPVAIKVLDLEASTGPRRTAFQREIEAIGRVGSHPNIVTVLGSGFTDDHHPYLVLPLFERGTFSRLIDENGPLTWSAAIDVGIKLCSAVETVHRAGVVHRDIKPGNVFVGVTPEHPLLADFGISSTVDGERTQTQTMAVTFGYTAPEVLDDERPTPASDIYSLAMTIFRLIQGLHAYHADTPAAVMRKIISDPDRPQLSAGVPTAVASVVADGLARDPLDRPATALDMARRLQRVQIDNGLPPTPVVVADEPAVEPERPDDETSMAEAADVETAMVNATRRRQRQAAANPEDGIGAVDLRPRPDSPGRGGQADVGRILADAILVASSSVPAETGREHHMAIDPSGSPHQPVRTTPLDSPTVVTPRRPRSVVDDEGAVAPTDSRRWWKVGLVALLIAVGIAMVAVLSRSGSLELAPIWNDSLGGFGP